MGLRCNFLDFGPQLILVRNAEGDEHQGFIIGSGAGVNGMHRLDNVACPWADGHLLSKRDLRRLGARSLAQLPDSIAALGKLHSGLSGSIFTLPSYRPTLFLFTWLADLSSAVPFLENDLLRDMKDTQGSNRKILRLLR